MKKILFLCPFSPCCNHAGTVYTRQLLNELSKNCIIDLVYFCYPSDKRYKEHDNISVLKVFEISTSLKIHGVLLNPFTFPLFSSRYENSIRIYLQSQINSTGYDFVYFDFSQSFAYAPKLKHPHKILMAHDVMAQKYSRMKTYLRPWAMRSERKMLKEGTVFTFSEKDCKLIKELYGINSYPTTFFLSKEVQEAKPKDGDFFVFFGGWDREENYETIEWYLDNVNHLIPEIKIKVIGGGLPDHLKERLKQYPNFEYLGFVDNPYHIIASAKAEIAPLKKGAGVKVKCIDALGCGTPVVGTEVAFEGIPKEFSEFMIKAERPSDYAEILSKLNISIPSRIMFKNDFISRYNNKKILSFIQGTN